MGKKGEITIKDGLTIETKVVSAKSPRLTSCAIYEIVRDSSGNIIGVHQVVYNADGSVFHQHQKFPGDSSVVFT